MRAPESAWRRHCPACTEGQFPLPMWEWRRRRERRCPSCGATIEFSVPSLPYYAFHVGTQIYAALAAPVLAVVFLLGSPSWAGIFFGVSIAVLLGLTIGSNYLFGRRVVLTRAEEAADRDVAYRRRF